MSTRLGSYQTQIATITMCAIVTAMGAATDDVGK